MIPEYTHEYWEGVRDGMRMYAYFKDGVQFVGSTGRRLKDALAETERLEALNTGKSFMASMMAARP